MFQKRFAVLTKWVARHHTVLTASIGSGIVTLWTVLRHISNGINFDVVGQVGISAQWLHGLHAGAQIGPTNYILKMPLYALINLMSWIDPKLRLLILALICNIGAFLLLYWLVRKITALYGTRTPWLADLGMLWLASIAGRVFWTDYANSRNLEVAGGVAVLYLCLQFWQIPSRRTALLLAGVAVATFFADPLQLYTIGVGIVVISGAAALWFRRTEPKRYLITMGILSAAILTSILLAKLVPHVLPLSFLASPSAAQALTVQTVPSTLIQAAKATLHLFDADILGSPLSPNSIRQIAMLALLCAAIYTIGAGVPRTARFPQIVLAGLIVLSYAVFTASGYAFNAHSERYLVLVPILVVLLFALQPSTPTRPRRTIYAWLGLVLVSSLLLVGAVIRALPSRYALDAPMATTAAFAQHHSYRFVLTSRQLAIPANYYAGYATTIVPLICTSSGRLTTSNLFYDMAAYRAQRESGEGSVAIIVPTDGIFSDPYHCSQAAILQQFGLPAATDTLNGVGTVYEYPTNSAAIRELN